MPRTLYGYILRELLKVLVASTGVLTAVMSVAFAIMSVSEAQLGPWSLVKIIFLVLPGMLTVALPFAAALAGTLVFFRMSQDNEITACAVSGISYPKLAVPVLALGLGLTGGMFWFSNWVVPRFWQMAEREGTVDAVRLAVRKVRERDVIEWGPMVIRADAAGIQTPEPVPDGPTPYSRLVLEGVAVGKVDAEMGVLDSYTARRAVIDMYRDEEGDRAYATMLLEEVSRNDPASGSMPYVGRITTESIEVPSFFQDRPQFMSLRRLQKLAQDPLRSPEVRQMRRNLIEAVARSELLGTIEGALRGVSGTVELLTRTDLRARVEGGSAVYEDNGKRLKIAGPGGGRVRVTLLVGDVPREKVEAEFAYCSVAQSSETGEPRVLLSLRNVSDPGVADARLAKRDIVLRPLHAPLQPLRQLGLPELMERTAGSQDKRVRTLRRNLDESIVSLRRGISSRVHERAATAVNCALVLMLGAAMSIWLRQRTPLTIYFWCFMPTVAAFLMISSGRQITSWHEMPVAMGLAMTWAGNAGLAGLVLGVFWKLRRN